MGTRLVLTLLGFITILVSACGPNHDQANGPSPEGSNNNSKIQKLLKNPERITFSDVSNLVLKKSCNECHSLKENLIRAGINFDSFESAQGLNGINRKAFIPFNAAESVMYKVLVIQAGPLHMPPFNRPQILKEQIDLVYSWIENGAKKESSDEVEIPPSLSEQLRPYFLNPEMIDYQTVNEYVFMPRCFRCHSTKSPDYDFEAVFLGQNMTDYESILNLSGKGSTGVIPGRLIDKWVNKKQEDGSFVKVKEKGSLIFNSSVVTQSMPPPKGGYEPISGLEAKLLRLWILNCAIEDYELIKNNDNLDEDAIEKQKEKLRICSE